MRPFEPTVSTWSRKLDLAVDAPSIVRSSLPLQLAVDDDALPNARQFLVHRPVSFCFVSFDYSTANVERATGVCAIWRPNGMESAPNGRCLRRDSRTLVGFVGSSRCFHTL